MDAILEIEAFNQDRKLADFSILLRTPPSLVSVDTRSLADWSQIAQRVGSALKSPTFAGQRISLLQVLEVTNHEERALEVELPKRPESAALVQAGSRLSYSDTGCSGSGYSVASVATPDRLSDDILILPFDQNFIRNAESLVRDPELKDHQVMRIEPGASALIGIYAKGAAASRWQEQGPLTPDLQSIGVPTTCYQACLERECDGHCSVRFCRSDFIQGLNVRTTIAPPSIHPLTCTCSRYETRRYQTSITVGTDRGGVSLQLPAPQTLMKARFADLDSIRDPQIRVIKFLSEQAEVIWAN